ncbi:hypothetical protein GCM10010112_80320 [Actinoplanes lobatus]|nr:hypothetical protein GCM10010112_80320 [Actinoplanes lobatus]GIE44925.1 hypothetical protein Alo02nite_78230 [Actinoplanes lobatus]
MRWDDGLDDVPWRELFGPEGGAEVVAALRELAEEGANGDRVYEALEDHDNDYWYAESYNQPIGFRPEALYAMRFLAGIAADPSGIGSTAALEVVESMIDQALDRPTMTGDELDAYVDALRAEVEVIRPLLEEAHRLGCAGIYGVPALLAGIDTGHLMGGAYEHRWRGVARPLVDSATDRLTILGDLLVTHERTGLTFRSTHDGTPVHDFRFPARAADRPHLTVDDLVWYDRMSVRPFVDGDGPGVLTVDLGDRNPRLWRLDGTTWREIFLRRPGLPLRPSAWKVRDTATLGGECYIRYRDGVTVRFGARTGEPSGVPSRAPLPLTADRYEANGRTFVLRREYGQVERVDAETGESAGSLNSVGYAFASCVYRVGDRPYLAVTGLRQLHRFDAVTGEEVGPPLFGHRRHVRDVTSAVVDGRPQLYSADGVTVRRWDAETGTPWPAPPPS